MHMRVSGTRKPAPLSSTPSIPTRAPILVPPPAALAPVLVSSTPSSSSPSVDPPPLLTPSQKKIILDSPVSITDSDDTTVSLSMPPESEGHGQRVFELSGLQYALQQGVCCNRCGTGSISLKEDLSKQQGLFTAPYLCCDDCSNITYTQNTNESLHSTLWKFCPKILFMGKNVEMACALATISFNDGSASLVQVSDQLQLKTTPHCKKYLRRKDRLRVKKSITSSSAHGKQARRAALRRRKGFEDKKKDSKGVMYSAGTFDTDIASSGPSKRPKN